MSEPNLLSEIEKFLARDDVSMTPTEFGVAVLNDGKLIPTLRNGRRVWPETAQKIRAFMLEYVPADGAAEGSKRSQSEAAA